MNILIKNSTFRALLFLIIVILSLHSVAFAQVKGKIKITMLEGGGNGAGYGFAGIIGPTGRTQSFTCPRTSLGDIPTGRTSCTTTYGSSNASEWQAGDKLRFFSFVSSSTDLPFPLRNNDVVRCYWTFKGWTGPCVPQGVVENARHECTLTLPASGDVEIGVIIEGSDCPALTGGSPDPGPTAAPTTPPGDSTLDGAAFAGAIGNAAADIIINLGLKSLLKASSVVLNLPAGSSDGTINVSLASTSSNSTSGRAQLGSRSLALRSSSSFVIASGKVASAANSTSMLVLKLTREGKAYLKGKMSATMKLNAQFKPDQGTPKKTYTKSKVIKVKRK